ncbi:MAG: 2-C-methyl-D-erythritol 4-phosphate cytidylyltransferase [Candidatus Aminicenantes bacterium]|nr:2-C-methyl-D-erythritol 4-phosphate cytidylyltransferase [Candidatus Aminicenantes bacterium]
MTDVTVIIVAAGSGRRFGQPKQFSILKGKTVLDWSLDRFSRHERVSNIALVLPQGARVQEIIDRYPKIVAVAEGGKTRQQSVAAGFRCLSLKPRDVVLVHDAARPLVSVELIDRVISGVIENGAAVPLIPIEDTVKEIEDNRILRTVERSKLYLAQTPQGFLFGILQRAIRETENNQWQGTDEASLVELMQYRVIGVPGEKSNIKITSPVDLKIAEGLLEN